MSVFSGPGEGTWSVFAQKVVEQRDALREENTRLRKALEHIADTCVQDPDTAQFAARVLDGSAHVEVSE